MGAGNGKPLKNQEKLEFPVTFELKVVYETIHNKNELMGNTEALLDQCSVIFSYQSSNSSAKGNYISLTYKVTIVSQEQLNQMYEGLKELPGIKFAL